ncbi:MAG: DUF115 domain-containing protein [Spirochaetes bacterium]|nr:DUF115 domain-containing protein [Spirochaetota bacterium]
MLLEKNLKALGSLKKAYHQIEDSLYPLEKTRNGQYTVKLNQIYLHSRFDPEKEAARYCELLSTDKNELDIIIVFGAGLGYIHKFLYQQFIIDNPSQNKPYIIYIEADLKLFFTSLSVIDWSEILEDDHFKFFLEAEKELIGSFIQSIPTKKMRYFHHRPSYLIHQDYYQEIKNYISYILDRKDMNTATFSRFQRLWTRNFIYNLPIFMQCSPINDLKNCALNSFAVVVAGGPTLEQSLGYLKKIHKQAIIIAVDTVYKYLVEHDIQPDMVVSIDPQFWNYKYLENCQLKNTICITDSFAYYKLFQLDQPEKYYAGKSFFPISAFFDQTDRGVLSAGGSVATTAYDTARIIGAKKIVLIGLDLSFPGRMTHFKGAFFETNFHSFADYFQTAETHAYHYLAHIDTNIVESTSGHPVTSDQKMVLFKRWFDREVVLTQASVYQPDLGGAKIDGANIASLDDLPLPEMNQIKSLNLKENKKDAHSILNQLTDQIRLFLNVAKDIQEYCKKITKYISEDGIIKDQDIPIVNQLEEDIYKDQDRKVVANIMLSSAQNLLISILENYQFHENEKQSTWIKFYKLYQTMGELADFYEKNMIKLLTIFPNYPNIKNVKRFIQLPSQKP